jgi:hypothetical protein
MDWGLRQWAPHLINLVLDRFAVVFELVSFYFQLPICIPHSTRITHDLHMSTMLGARYHRLNPQLPRNIPLDAGNVNSTIELKRQAKKKLRCILSFLQLRTFLN